MKIPTHLRLLLLLLACAALGGAYLYALHVAVKRQSWFQRVSPVIKVQASESRKARFEATYPDDVKATLPLDCVAEGYSPEICYCYAWEVMDEFSFGRLSVLYAVDPEGTEQAVADVFSYCLPKETP